MKKLQVTWSDIHAWAVPSRVVWNKFLQYHWPAASSRSRGQFFGCAWLSSRSFAGMTKSTALRQNRGGSGSRTRTITTFTTQSTFYCTRNRFAQVCQKNFCGAVVLDKKIGNWTQQWHTYQEGGRRRESPALSFCECSFLVFNTRPDTSPSKAS